MAIILLVGAGLLIRSLWSVENVDPGFRPERVLSIALPTPAFRAAAQRADFYNRVLEQIESLPGVESAGITSDLFISGNPERIVTAEGDTRTVPSACGSEATRSARDSSRLSGLLCSGGASFRPRTGLILRLWRSSMMRWLAGCGPGAMQWARGSSSGRRIPPARGSRSSESWATCAARDWRTHPIPQMFEPLAQNPSRLATLLVRTSMDDPLKMVGAIQLPCVEWKNMRRSMA